MDISEMQIKFRQYAQQMGMQNVRAITPEQIDIILNTSISDIVNQLIRENINNSNPNNVIDTPKIGQLDSLGTLYIKDTKIADAELTQRPIVLNFDELAPNCFYFIGLSINYSDSNGKESEYFPVRVFDDVYLSETLTDFILSPKYKSPAASIYNTSNNYKHLDIYVAKEVQKVNNKLHGVKYRYIKTPAKVSKTNNISCDLPDRLHESVVKHAVDLYRNSINGGAFVNNTVQAQPQTEDNI